MSRPLVLTAMMLALAPAALPEPPATPKTTDVLVMLSVKPGIARERVMGVMQDEIRDTVRYYLNGKIRQWYSRADGKGVVFILAAGDVDQARAIMESLPLYKENLVNLDYTALTPLSPLGLLLEPAPSAK
jgi:hypothetical protein